MRDIDVINAKNEVEQFLRDNGVTNIYNGSKYGIYVNWTNKAITLHGENSSKWKQAKQDSTNISNIFKGTDNGFWIGGFGDFSTANTFGDLLRQVLVYKTHEEVSYGYSTGINQNFIKIR